MQVRSEHTTTLDAHLPRCSVSRRAAAEAHDLHNISGGCGIAGTISLSFSVYRSSITNLGRGRHEQLAPGPMINVASSLARDSEGTIDPER